MKTPQELRRQLYESIIDETMFISRASEGALSTEWIMNQPIFIRKKYLDMMKKELEERESKLNAKTNNKGVNYRNG